MPGFNTSVANMPGHALKNFAYRHKAVLDRVWNLWQLAIVAPASSQGRTGQGCLEVRRRSLDRGD